MGENDISVVLLLSIDLIGVDLAGGVRLMRDDLPDGPGLSVYKHGVPGGQGFDLFRVVMVFEEEGGGEPAAAEDLVSIFDGEAEGAVFQVDIILLVFQGTDLRGAGADGEAQDKQQDKQDGRKMDTFHVNIPPIA